LKEEATLSELGRAMAEGSLSAAELTAWYAERIRRLDHAGPRLGAVPYLNPEAEAIAESLDRERAAGRVRGPLHGIPVLFKANINTGDRIPTTAGSQALHGFLPGADAPLVARLREAGAVILGKTNMSEWANFRSTRSVSGWSSEGGQTRNPYALDRSPSGSSSGSAVAVSANLCALAVGTETDGSIVSPSSLSGIAGIKPTLGLVSAAGIIPVAPSQDTAGPMARTLGDAALLLAAMAEPGPVSDRLQAIAAAPPDADLRGLRIGYAARLAGFHPLVDQVMTTALDALRALGAEIVTVDLARSAAMNDAEATVMLYEFKQGLQKYLAAYGAATALRTLEDVIAYNRDHADTVMPLFGQEILEQAAASGDLDADEYRRALRACRRHSRTEGLDRYFGRDRLDAVAAPSGGPAWKIDPIVGDHYLGGSAGYPAIAGYPNLTVPAGFVHRLPVGVSFFGPRYSDPLLIRLGLAFEAATRVRRPPTFPASVDVFSDGYRSAD